jgi:hypothetical protein
MLPPHLPEARRARREGLLSKAGFMALAESLDILLRKNGVFGKQLITEEMGALLMFGSKQRARSIFIGFVHYFIVVKKER